MDMNMLNPDRIEIAFNLVIVLLGYFGLLMIAGGIACLFNKAFGSRTMATRLPRAERRE